MSNAVTEQIIEREKRRKITQGENIRKAGESAKIGIDGTKKAIANWQRLAYTVND